MRKISFLLVFLIFFISCTQVQENPAPMQEPVQKSTTNAPPIQQEEVREQPKTNEKVFDKDIKDLIEKSSTRVKSLSYNYRGPENENEVYTFYLKGNNIKYLPPRAIKSLDRQDAYDSVFIDNLAKTASQYCDSLQCAFRGKKQDLVYDAAYILTPIDWIKGVDSAQKKTEEVIDNRKTWVVETNKGTLWLDTFYGVPLEVESNGKSYKYMQMAFNGVQDSQIVPSSK